MATVTELRSHVQRVASLNTSDATEAALVLAWLNDGYARALGNSGAYNRITTYTPASAATTIAAASYIGGVAITQGTVGVSGVYRNLNTSGGQGAALKRVSLDEISRLRALNATSSDGPATFSVRASTGAIELWPAANGTDVITIEMTMYPMQLAIAAATGYEATPTAIPVQFHYDLLANFALARAFEYRGDISRAQYHRQQSENSMGELAMWINEQGGIMGPDVKVIRNRSVSNMQPGQLN